LSSSTGGPQLIQLLRILGWFVYFWTDCPLCSTFSVTKPEVLMIGLRTKYTETEIETYSAEELGQLFGACTVAERLAFQFFLGTGCREREVMFAR
jgi:hypothetical protein